MIAIVEKTDHLYELVAEAVNAEGQRCPECHDVAHGNLLFEFSIVRGNKVRKSGIFCSRSCHDTWHGVAPRDVK